MKRTISIAFGLTALLVSGCIGWNAFTEYREARYLAERAEADHREFLRLLAQLAESHHGTATWYERGLPNPLEPTCASRYWPRGTRLAVSSKGRVVLCRVNDYGPEAQTGHLLDLSRGAWQALGEPLSTGIIPVRVWVVQ